MRPLALATVVLLLQAACAAAWNTGSAAAVGAFFAADARVEVAAEEASGREEIVRAWIAPDAQRVRDVAFLPRRVAREGEEWTESGRVALTFLRPGGTAERDAGEYAHRWTRGGDGAWVLRHVRMTGAVRPPRP